MQQILYWVLVKMAEHWARSSLHFQGRRLRLCAQKRNKELGQHPAIILHIFPNILVPRAGRPTRPS